MIPDLVNSPAFLRIAELKERFAWYYDSPAYRMAEYANDDPLGVLKRINEEFKRLNGYRPNSELLEYLEETAKTNQKFAALNEEIDQKAEIIGPVVRQYRTLIEQEYGIFLGSVREIVIALYLCDDIEEMRYFLPDTIAKDLKRYAIEKKAEFLAFPVGNDESNGLTVHSSTLAELSAPNQSEAAPAGNQSGPTLAHSKPPRIKALALAYYYLHELKEMPRFVPIMEKAYEVARDNGIKAEHSFYQAYCDAFSKKNRDKSEFYQYKDWVLAYLKPYPKAFQLADNELNSK